MAGTEEHEPELVELMELEEADPAELASGEPSIGQNDDRHQRLRQLAYQRNVGMISNAEFEAEKARIFSDWVAR